MFAHGVDFADRRPERNSARVTACLSSNEIACAGAIQLAEAPPDISTSTRSFLAGVIGKLERAIGALQPRRIGDRVSRPPRS
jgi:hypothetical protein